LLRGAGKRLFVHTVITGGQALADTLNGFGQLANSTSERNIVVWVAYRVRDGISSSDRGGSY
jgi:hypothetical protein